MKQTYWAIVYQDAPDTGYGATFPDFPGCVTVGDDIPAPTAFEALPVNPEPEATESGRIPVTVARGRRGARKFTPPAP
ncbi:MAG: hypothetical protein ABID63_19215 [Pseudomonadota bacterium]